MWRRERLQPSCGQAQGPAGLWERWCTRSRPHAVGTTLCERQNSRFKRADRHLTPQRRHRLRDALQAAYAHQPQSPSVTSGLQHARTPTSAADSHLSLFVARVAQLLRYAAQPGAGLVWRVLHLSTVSPGPGWPGAAGAWARDSINPPTPRPHHQLKVVAQPGPAVPCSLLIAGCSPTTTPPRHRGGRQVRHAQPGGDTGAHTHIWVREGTDASDVVAHCLAVCATVGLTTAPAIRRTSEPPQCLTACPWPARAPTGASLGACGVSGACVVPADTIAAGVAVTRAACKACLALD